MDVLKCEAFIQCADTGSFTAAGEILGYSQSGITRMVRSLETELGCTLLVRDRRGTHPTADGEKLLPIMRDLCRSQDRLIQASADINGLTVGELRMGVYFSIAASWLPHVIRVFKIEYPNIHIDIDEELPQELSRMLDEHSVDFCLMSRDDSLPCKWIPLKEDRMVVWLPPDHPYAQKKKFPLEKINGASFIGSGLGGNTDCEKLIAQEHLSPDIQYSTKDANSLFAMVEAGLGITINNELTSAHYSGNVAVLPLDPPHNIMLSAAIPNGQAMSPAAEKFIEYLKRYVKSL
ncbi:MAG: LysR family transcriptional regulator [Eubacteriaceae bacterium]|jgi:DNA-binding transcriptional LysR family regulator|nr:LysR family transcriptional regulator [Eubacteriaceae bacterium]